MHATKIFIKSKFISKQQPIIVVGEKSLKYLHTAGFNKILHCAKDSKAMTSFIEKKLSVRQTEKFVQLFKKKRHKSKIIKDTNIIALELSVSNKIGLNVEIQNNKRNKGKILFEYKDLDQLNKIIDIIKSNY